MAFHRLTWRIALPFVLLVLLETVGLAMFLGQQMANEERGRLQRLAFANALLIENTSLPTTTELAASLRSISDYAVFFRRYGRLEPDPEGALRDLPLANLPADRQLHRHGDFECIAVPIENKHDLLLVHRQSGQWIDPRVMPVLAAFLLLALLTTWLVGRDLVRPLRNLASQLPRLEAPGALTLPEAARSDEIGDLARALLRTQQALHDEQAARERMEKLAVLGRMTAALAHEVQNPIAAIRMHAQLWRGPDPDGAKATIEQEALRIEGMLNQWMFLTRPEPPATAPVDIGALLTKVTAMQRHQAEHAAVRIDLATAPDLVVTADSRRLEQVFRNLLTNAVQAMPGGGTLTIRAERHGADVRITFADTGVGFSAEALRRFAEYFFSEKEGGMGIGLSVADEILKAHGGRLRAAPRESGGAVVTAELPAAPA